MPLVSPIGRREKPLAAIDHPSPPTDADPRPPPDRSRRRPPDRPGVRPLRSRAGRDGRCRRGRRARRRVARAAHLVASAHRPGGGDRSRAHRRRRHGHRRRLRDRCPGLPDSRQCRPGRHRLERRSVGQRPRHGALDPRDHLDHGSRRLADRPADRDPDPRCTSCAGARISPCRSSSCSCSPATSSSRTASRT